MNSDITNYINNSPQEQREIMEALRQLIHEAIPDVQESFKWSRPVFGLKKDFVYILAAKNYVTLGFMNYQKINDPQHLLEGTGKDMRHLKLKSVKGLDVSILKEWVLSVSEV